MNTKEQWEEDFLIKWHTFSSKGGFLNGITGLIKYPAIIDFIRETREQAYQDRFKAGIDYQNAL